jgi:hypothetical protein
VRDEGGERSFQLPNSSLFSYDSFCKNGIFVFLENGVKANQLQFSIPSIMVNRYDSFRSFFVSVMVNTLGGFVSFWGAWGVTDTTGFV